MSKIERKTPATVFRLACVTDVLRHLKARNIRLKVLIFMGSKDLNILLLKKAAQHNDLVLSAH